VEEGDKTSRESKSRLGNRLMAKIQKQLDMLQVETIP